MSRKPDKKSTAIAGGAAVAGVLLAFKISAGEVQAWIEVLVGVIQHPASTILLILLTAFLMAWLFVRSTYREAGCRSEVDVLKRQLGQQQSQLDAVHALLALDRRYSKRLPSLEDWRAGKFDLAAIASAGYEPEHRSPSFHRRR